MSAPCLFGRREEIERLNQEFASLVRSDASKLAQLRAPCARAGASVAVVSGPAVLSAAGRLADAAKRATDLARRAGDDEVADKQFRVLLEGFQSAFDRLDESAVSPKDEDDPLYEAGIDRLVRRGRRGG